MQKQTWLKICCAALLLCAAPAHAQDEDTVNKNTQQHTVSPDGCDFEITFPGEPYTARRCNPDNPDQCNRIISYTKVYNLDATVNFNITCNPITDGAFDRYSGPVMQATLEAMLAKNKLESYQTDFAETADYKQAILVGHGELNGDDHMYSAQLWIGKNSVFSVEGEVIGYGGPEADELFVNVMTSAHHKASTEAANEQADEEPAEDTEQTPAEPVETGAE